MALHTRDLVEFCHTLQTGFRSAAFRSVHAAGFSILGPEGVGIQVVLLGQHFPWVSESQAWGLCSEVVSPSLSFPSLSTLLSECDGCLGAHGWVARICSHGGSLHLGAGSNSGSSWMSWAPNLHLGRQHSFVALIQCFLTLFPYVSLFRSVIWMLHKSVLFVLLVSRCLCKKEEEETWWKWKKVIHWRMDWI